MLFRSNAIAVLSLCFLFWVCYYAAFFASLIVERDRVGQGKYTKRELLPILRLYNCGPISGPGSSLVVD